MYANVLDDAKFSLTRIQENIKSTQKMLEQLLTVLGPAAK